MNARYQLSSRLLMVATAVLVGGCGGYGSSYDSSSAASNKVVSIAVTPTSATISTTGSQQFDAKPKNSSGDTVSGVTITWHSSDTSVATIDDTGLATAVGAGTTQITATAPNYSSSMYNSTTVTSNATSLTVSGSGLMSGTAQSKMALPNRVVQVRDATGQTVTGLSGADGRYTFMTEGLTPPFLLRTEDANGHAWYALATGEGITNINPATDWMARQWAQYSSFNLEAVFRENSTWNGPSAGQLTAMDRSLVQVLAASLTEAGLNPASFSFLHYRAGADAQAANTLLARLQIMDSGTTALRDRRTGLAVTTRVTDGSWRIESRSAQGELLAMEPFVAAGAVAQDAP